MTVECYLSNSLPNCDSGVVCGLVAGRLVPLVVGLLEDFGFLKIAAALKIYTKALELILLPLVANKGMYKITIQVKTCSRNKPKITELNDVKSFALVLEGIY